MRRCFLLRDLVCLLLRASLVMYFVFVANLVYASMSTVDADFRVNYDPVVFSSGEEMGLLGTTVLSNIFQVGVLDFGAGVGVYSAVKGSRGGFFTGGLALNARFYINQVIFETGYFIGGGGGDGAPQGGGLMLRPHISILYDFKRFSAGISLNKIKFPNGAIDSNQIGIQIDMPFQLALLEKRPVLLEGLQLRWEPFYVAPTLQWYEPRSGAKTTSGLPMNRKIRLIGIEFGKFMNDSLYFYVESAGAYQGGADGYAELLGGAGFQLQFFNQFTFRIKGAMGSSGGGHVDTGGGLIGKGTLGLAYGITPDLSLEFDYGWVGAIKGSFSAMMMKTALSYQFETAIPSRNVAHPIMKAQDRSKPGRWAIRLSGLRYLSSSDLRKTREDRGPVDLFALKLDRYLSPSFYLTGQAGAAVRGEAGGYATGHFGAGLTMHWTEKLIAVGEILGGAGGGGGLASGSGAIVQPMLGVRYLFFKNQGVQVMVGHIYAPGGSMNDTVIDVGWVYTLRTLERVK